MTKPTSPAVASALRTLTLERQGVAALEDALQGGSELAAGFEAAVGAIQQAAGRVIVTGIGKSGHIARKIASTLASTGQAAAFVHPSEASHGDLGMLQSSDVVLALSKSGESPELAAIITYAKRFAIPLIAMTSRPESALGREADVVVRVPEAAEACPNGLAPTTSTTMQLALGDALAIALLEAKGFTARDFGVLHPGGKLGAQLAYVSDIMHTGDRVPRTKIGARMAEAILEMSAKGFGCVAVLDAKGALAGIITDGDLRRHLRSTPIVDTPVEEVMTRTPRTIAPDALVAEALELISRKISGRRVSALLVVSEGEVVGIVHFHDLMRLGAI
jgi:arabinose-5-phosphate isomerase